MSYCDYDYEKEPNYPEVEEIIDKASGKFEEFLRKAFVNEYKNIQGASENNARVEKLLNEREKSLREKELKLQERESELAKSEEVQYEKLKSKWFTELGLAFDIGSTVYYVKDITQRAICPTCNGNKKVKAKVENVNNTLSDFEINCPTCNGWGTVQGKKEYEIVEAKVEQIDAHIQKRQGGSIHIEYTDNCFDLITRVWVRDKKGNDSHYIKGCDLYKSKEECEKAIKTLKGGE